MRDLTAKGPKYREPCKVEWDKNLSLLCEAVDQYALQWANKVDWDKNLSLLCEAVDQYALQWAKREMVEL